jgi:ketol-acid reductoisomerase
MIETTFAEGESDLFVSRRPLRCLRALMQAGFEILVDAGYQPEIAYYECINELKLIVDLIYEGGFGHMRASISDVAEYGDLTRGQLVIDEHVRTNMQQLLEDVRNGSFARELIAEE